MGRNERRGFNRSQLFVGVKEIEIYAKDIKGDRRPAIKVTFHDWAFERDELVSAVLDRIFLFLDAGGESYDAACLGYEVSHAECSVTFFRRGEWPEKYHLCFIRIIEVLAAHYSFVCTRTVPDDLLGASFGRKLPNHP